MRPDLIEAQAALGNTLLIEGRRTYTPAEGVRFSSLLRGQSQHLLRRGTLRIKWILFT